MNKTELEYKNIIEDIYKKLCVYTIPGTLIKWN